MKSASRSEVEADEAERGESRLEQLDRNWAELLQELRVMQTGVQLLTGVLLTVPFQQRFHDATSDQRALYLATVSSALAATTLFQAPVSVHRLLFRQHERAETVRLAHRMTLVGIVFLALALTGAAALVFDIAAGSTAGVVAGVVAGSLLAALWACLPVGARRRNNQKEKQCSTSST